MFQIYLRSVNLPKSFIRRPRLSPRKRCIADLSLNQVILTGNAKGFIVFPHLSGVVLGRIVTLTFQFKSLVGGKTPQPQPPSLPRGCLAFDLGCIDVSTMDCEKSLRNCFMSFYVISRSKTLWVGPKCAANSPPQCRHRILHLVYHWSSWSLTVQEVAGLILRRTTLNLTAGAQICASRKTRTIHTLAISMLDSIDPPVAFLAPKPKECEFPQPRRLQSWV